MGVIDEIVPEPLGGAHRDHRAMAMTLKGSVLHALQELSAIPHEELLDRRYEKFRRIGVFEEAVAESEPAADPPSKNGRP
jgi:acetyl-CoA carboxylase carboxyl transferase subunit alpha